MDSIISTFHLDWKIIIAQAFNFGLVFFVLYRYVFKPLSKTMDERKTKIQKGLEDAKENTVILSQTEANYEAILLKARLEAQAIFQKIKGEAELKKTEIIEDAKKEALNIVENGKKALENEKKKMISEEHNEIVALIMSGIEKLLGQKMDTSLNTKAIEDLGRIK